MSKQGRTLTREEVLRETGMSAAELDRRNETARRPAQPAPADRLSPSEGGGCSSRFKEACVAQTPPQQPAAACPSDPAPTETIFVRTNRVREEAAGLREPATRPPACP